MSTPVRQQAGSYRRLQAVHERGGVDLDAAQRAVADLLTAFGRDPVSEHLCMSLRGVRAVGSRTVTSALQGDPLREDARSRQEFFALEGVHG